jgi:hypothetical protein
VRGEVHDGVDAVRGEHAVDQRAVADTAGDQLGAAHRLAKPGG